MAHVKLVEKPKGFLQRYAWRYSRKNFGVVPEPTKALAIHPGVLMASGALETTVAKKWKSLDPHLKWLALQATSMSIGCSWCIDYGYYEGVQSGVPAAKVRDVASWRNSDTYDERERLVLEYADAINKTPSAVPEDLADQLRRTFSEKEIVELTGWIALENYRSRFNAGLGLKSEGFSEHCEVPAEKAWLTSTTSSH